MLKKLRKAMLAAGSTEEVEALKEQMHVAEVDLNYTQYHPLSETYISLYLHKNSNANEKDSAKEEEERPKPPMWAEVEKCMEDGTLNRLRNRVANAPANVPKPPVVRPAKTKLAPTPVITTGMSRRERRSQRGAKETKSKNKSMGFAKNQAWGASQAAQKNDMQDGKDDDSDGSFFEQ